MRCCKIQKNQHIWSGLFFFSFENIVVHQFVWKFTLKFGSMHQLILKALLAQRQWVIIASSDRISHHTPCVCVCISLSCLSLVCNVNIVKLFIVCLNTIIFQIFRNRSYKLSMIIIALLFPRTCWLTWKKICIFNINAN